ncbi:MAG TPA: sodium/proton-translocating pyrophosphatase, partial [Byssovorax sp.]
AAAGARRSLDDALQIAMRGGAVSGVFVSSVSLLGLAALFTAVLAYKGAFSGEPAAALQIAPSAPLMIVGYALGGGFAALLAQLGGGAFAKAADVGADLAALDAGLGDDATRNPGVEADLAGDALGDGAARATALFASSTAENIGAMLAGAALFKANAGVPSALAVMLFPLVARGFGVVATTFGVVVVRTDDREDPLAALGRGLYVAATLQAVGMAGAAKWLLGPHWVAFFAAGLVGVVAAAALFPITAYFVEARHRPVRAIADASRAGVTLSLLEGLATGGDGAVVVLALGAAATIAASVIGARTGLSGGALYALAVASMGFLGTSGYMLALDAFGPALDGASGVVEATVAIDRPDVRGRAAVLDAVGNTAKALSRAHATAAALITSLLLVSAYLDEVRRRALARGLIGAGALHARLDSPEVLIAALAGALLVVWVAARVISTVGRAARRVLEEARRQLRRGEGPAAGPRARRPSGDLPDAPRGARDGAPDPAACVEIASRAALRSILAPALASVAVPVVVGMALRFAR